MIHLHEVKPSKKGSVEAFIKERFDDNRTRMVDFHREWALTLAWVRGHQNVDFNVKTNTWIRPKTNPWQTRLISNLLLPMVRNKVARQTAVRPVWDVIPATPDPDDIEIARTSTKIARHKWITLDMTRTLIRTLFWQSTCGNCFMKVGWDKEAGDEIQIPSRDIEDELISQFMALNGIEEAPETINIRQGEEFVDVVPPFNISVDPLVALFEESPYVIESNIRSIDWIVDKFGTKWKDKIGETDSADVLIHPFVFSETTEKTNRRGVLVHELYIEKSRQFKNGSYALMADGQFLVTPTKFPFDHGKKPYIHYMEIYDPVSMWGTCVAQQTRGNQARYNRIQSVITDHINLTSKVQWLIPRRAQVTAITNKPGQNIEYSGNIQPSQTKPSNIPMYVENTLERTRRDMQDTSSLHNVSQGQNEPGVRSGRAILALQDTDDSIEGPTFLWLDNAIARTGVLVLKIINQFVAQEQILQLVGEFNELETLTYTGAMLQGKNSGDYFDVRVKTLGRQSMSRATREAQVTGFIEIGLLDPIRDRDTIFAMLGDADTMTIVDEEAIDRTRQWNEIQRMLQGEQVQVLIGENHGVHLTTIKKFMASSKRDKASPESLQMIQEHVVQHMNMQAGELVQQQLIIQGAIANATGNGNTDGNGQAAGRAGGRRESGAKDRNTGANTGTDRFSQN